MSDTPISDSTPHNVAELGMLCRRLERQLNAANEMFRKLNIHALNLTDRIRRLEEEIMDAKNKHAALVADVVLYEDRGERIKRLEEAGDLMVQHFYTDEPRSEMWEKAKEAKP
jgi:predicted nuclease with TOPRIM domain